MRGKSFEMSVGSFFPLWWMCNFFPVLLFLPANEFPTFMQIIRVLIWWQICMQESHSEWLRLVSLECCTKFKRPYKVCFSIILWYAQFQRTVHYLTNLIFNWKKKKFNSHGWNNWCHSAVLLVSTNSSVNDQTAEMGRFKHLLSMTAKRVQLIKTVLTSFYQEFVNIRALPLRQINTAQNIKRNTEIW